MTDTSQAALIAEHTEYQELSRSHYTSGDVDELENWAAICWRMSRWGMEHMLASEPAIDAIEALKKAGVK